MKRKGKRKETQVSERHLFLSVRNKKRGSERGREDGKWGRLVWLVTWVMADDEWGLGPGGTAG